MRARREAGLTLFQILLTVALVWGAVVLFRSPPAWLGGLLNRDAGARGYFNRVLVSVEKSRAANGNVPLQQPCSSLTLGRIDASDVASCEYLPSASRDFYMVMIVSKSGEVFRYAGRGGH